ncbi:MAG: class I SAM-dependent methyltransferase [Xanthomonadales bacterium]|nr:class I SAM-dependent methyltransferase [Xanthomonadales bacterium]
MRKTTFEHLQDGTDLQQQTYGDWPIWQRTIPFPSNLLMGSSGTHLLETYLVVGSAWWQVLSHDLKPGAAVLDIGCGCAKIARFLALDPRVVQYVGFDPIPQSIEWSNAFVVPRAFGRFRFEHVDLYSAEYNPQGTIQPTAFRFPGDDASYDILIAASLFTHLLEADARHYLAEAARVMKPEGRFVLSIHDEPPEGERYVGGEARVDIALDYFLSMARDSGLDLADDLGSLCGQHALVFQRLS